MCWSSISLKITFQCVWIKVTTGLCRCSLRSNNWFMIHFNSQFISVHFVFLSERFKNSNHIFKIIKKSLTLEQKSSIYLLQYTWNLQIFLHHQQRRQHQWRKHRLQLYHVLCWQYCYHCQSRKIINMSNKDSEVKRYEDLMHRSSESWISININPISCIVLMMI